MRIAMLGPFGLHPNKTMRSRAQQLATAAVALGNDVEIIMPPWQTPDEAGQVWEEEGVTLRYVDLQGGIIPVVRRMLAAAAAFEPDVIYGFKPKAYSGLCMWWLWRKKVVSDQLTVTSKSANNVGESGRLHQSGDQISSFFFAPLRLCVKGLAFFRKGGHQNLNQKKRPILITDTDDWEGWGGWNDISDYSLLQKYFFAWQERWGMAHCDYLTVASRELERRALAHGIPAERIIYLPNGSGLRIDPRPTVAEIEAKRTELGLGSRPTLLLYSRLFEFDTERLIKILVGVKKKIPDVAILMIGAGLFAEQAAEMRQRLEAAGLLENCVDVGWLDEAELPQTILAGHVGLYLMDDTLLNRTKCPVKLADMVGLGLPVVAEGVGQVSEYVQDGKTGYLRPTGDVPGLINGLVELLQTSEHERIAMGKQAISHYQKTFSWLEQTIRLTQILG